MAVTPVLKGNNMYLRIERDEQYYTNILHDGVQGCTLYGTRISNWYMIRDIGTGKKFGSE